MTCATECVCMPVCNVSRVGGKKNKEVVPVCRALPEGIY